MPGIADDADNDVNGRGSEEEEEDGSSLIFLRLHWVDLRCAESEPEGPPSQCFACKIGRRSIYKRTILPIHLQGYSEAVGQMLFQATKLNNSIASVAALGRGFI